MLHYNRYAWLADQQQHQNNSHSVGSSNVNNQQHNSSTNNQSLQGEGDLHGFSRQKRFACKWTDCSFMHESRGRVLKHIRVHHLMSSQNPGRAQLQTEEQQRAAALEYLDVHYLSDSSFYY